MSTYQIVSVLWEDHTVYRDSALPAGNLEEVIPPSLTVGILYKETDRYLIIISHIERQDSDVDICDYTIILKSALLAIKQYGKIKINKLRIREGRS